MSGHKKIVTVLLFLYWPLIFVLTHIPRIPLWVRHSGMSDKAMHYILYLVLGFLWWAAVSNGEKVKWHKQAVWRVLGIILTYAILDEWFQQFVGRGMDLLDIRANILGTFSSLIVLTFLSFWPGAFVLMAILVFMLTNFSRIFLLMHDPVLVNGVYFSIYFVLTLLWFQSVCFSKVCRRAFWGFVVFMSLPLLFLLTNYWYSNFKHRGFDNIEVMFAGLGVFAGAAFSIVLKRVLKSQR